MTKKVAKIVITKSGSSSECSLLSAVVKKEGTRTVDTAEFKVPATTDVDESDLVSYIQDIGDVTNLVGVYNFQGSTRDEGGFNLDGDNVGDGIIKPNANKTVSGKTFDNTTNNLKNHMNYGIIYTGTKTSISHNSRFDFSQQFEIICMASTRNTSSGAVGDKKIFFSKFDPSGNGIEIGIILNSVTFGYLTDELWTGYARVRFNSIERIYKHSWSVDAESVVFGGNISSNRTFILRLWRAEDNKLRFTVDNYQNGSWFNDSTSLNILELDTTDTSSQSFPQPPFSLSNTNPIWIGSGRNNSNAETNKWDGIAYQLKIYSGGYLDSEDVELYHTNYPTPTTIKFSGHVFYIKDSVKEKTLTCKGNSDIILNFNFNSSQFDSSTPPDSASVTRVTVGGIKKNIYPANTKTNTVMRSLILLADPEFIVVDEANSSGSNFSYSFSGNYIAEGSFLANVRTILNGLSDVSFWSNSRKTIFIEDDDGIFSNIEFVSNRGTDIAEEKYGVRGVKILEMGKSDNYMINSIELFGRQFLKHATQGLGTATIQTVKTLNFFPHNLTLTSNSVVLSQDSDYTVNYDERKITFLNNFPFQITADYDYEDVSSSSDSYYTTKDVSSIGSFGVYSKRFFVPQLIKRQDFERLGQKLINHNSSSKQRFEVHLPYLANHLRENHRVNLKNLKAPSGVNLTIKQIEWHYPQGFTILQVGENLIDGFDLDQSDSMTLSSSLSSIQKTKV